MTPPRLLLAAAFVAVFAAGARADRLGGNYRGPGEAVVPREDPPPGGVPFLPTVEAGRKEAAFSGKPLLVLLVLPGSPASEGAFRDAEVAALAARFVPVLADAEREEAFGVSRGVRTLPTLLLLDAAGAEVGRAEGEVGPAEAAEVLRRALRRAGPDRPTKAARALAKAAAALDRAREAKEWRAVLAAAAAIEEIGHEGAILDGARAARKEAADEAARRLAEAKRSIRDGKRDEARRALARIAREFAGLDEAVEAANLLKEMDGPDPGAGGGGGGGGTGTKAGATQAERFARADGDLRVPIAEGR